MAKNGISKQQILQVAKEMAFSSQLPTAFKVRDRLKTGSITTIQKHLHKWKIDCFKNANLSMEANIDAYNSELDEKNRILEQTVNKQIIQNEYYANELINAEKTIVKLKAENYNLQTTNQKLQLQLDSITSNKTILENLYHELKSQLDSNNNEIINKQQQIIDEMRAEIKSINQTSLEAIRQTSQNGHALLMQAKVEQINLQAKIDDLQKQLNDAKQQLNLSINKIQTKQQPLLQQIAWQQKIIQEHVGFDKLQQIENQEMLASYAK